MTEASDHVDRRQSQPVDLVTRAASDMIEHVSNTRLSFFYRVDPNIHRTIDEIPVTTDVRGDMPTMISVVRLKRV